MMRLGKNALTALGSLLAALLAIEGILRVFPGVIPLGALVEFEPALRSSIAARRRLQRASDTVPLTRHDGGPPDRLWVYAPRAEITYDFEERGIVNTVQMDDNGFCNPQPHSYRKPRFDVIALGDSFAWCTTVRPEDAWPAVFARLSGMSTYNLGLPGRGLQEYLEIFKTFGLAKHPRFVIVSIYEGNDFRDAYRFHEWKTGSDDVRTAVSCPFPWPGACAAHEALAQTPLGRYSYAYNLVAGGVWHIAADVRERAYDFRYDVEFPDGKTMPFNTRNGDLNELEYAKRLRDGGAGLDVFDDAMEGLAALARSEEFRIVLAYTPAAYTAYAGRVRFHAADVADIMRLYSTRQREYFARKSAELGFELVDMSDALGAAAAALGSDEPLYFRTNSHLTARGHEVVAQALGRDPVLAKARARRDAGVGPPR